MATTVLINPFEVPEGVPDEAFLAGWERAAEYMRRQPGFVTSRLHRSLAPDAKFRFVNIAEWESPAHFQAAVSTPEFRELAGRSPANYPSVYRVVRTL